MKKCFFIAVVISTCLGCIEPFEAPEEDFLDALVVDATISDDLKNQTVYLTRTYRSETGFPEPEEGAQVRLEIDSFEEIGFEEVSNGVYQSVIPFAAQPEKSYRLYIITSNGKSYSSNELQLPTAVTIDSVYAKRIIDDFGREGIAILVDSFDETGNSQNFRYEYEETYKIIAPEWKPFDLLSTGIECGVDIVPKIEQDQICFASNTSNGIILGSTSGLVENRVEGFMVHFLDRSNYVISHRYSIEVTQFTHSDEAYAFFNALDEFSTSESLFSETQPGFLVGNIFSDGDKNEKVLGYFDVSAVSTKRIFLNYTDFFPNEDLPPYVTPCEIIAPKLISQGGARCILSAMVDAGEVSYFDENQDPPFEEGPYLVMPRACGDCTVLGTNVEPEFWIE